MDESDTAFLIADVSSVISIVSDDVELVLGFEGPLQDETIASIVQSLIIYRSLLFIDKCLIYGIILHLCANINY